MCAVAAQNLDTLDATDPKDQSDILRFSTAGSVDDGKSTLIGRLLYDTKTVYDDQLVSIQNSGINRADGPMDLSLLTDGLRAEREQGITIDVAYRYFSTARRKFIIADTPGHEQYTRNMATGASTAHAAVVLVDASKKLLPQSRRHTYIASLLGIPHVVAAVNKMDLMDYREDVFREIALDFQELARQLGIANVLAIPVSALRGDNVVERSRAMPWFDGPTLLEYLEDLPVQKNRDAEPLRFPIQCVIRPDSRFRGFAGQIASGQLHRGSAVTTFPSGIRTRVKSITTFDGELDEAGAGSSIAITLEDEIDLGRGDLLSEAARLPQSATLVRANLVWFHPQAGLPGNTYLLKHTTRTVRARLQKILHVVDVNTFAQVSAQQLQMNDIAAVNISTASPLFFDPYRQSRIMGSFILLDPLSNATVAAGMIEEGYSDGSLPNHIGATSMSQPVDGPVMPGKLMPGKQTAAALWIVDRADLARELQQVLQQEQQVQLVSGLEFQSEDELTAVAKVLRRLETVVVFSIAEDDPILRNSIASIFGQEFFFHASLPEADAPALMKVMEWFQGLQKTRTAGQEKS